MDDIRLTQYSHGAGCGCKISPAVLDSILHSEVPKEFFSALLVGNDSRDDAAVYDLGDGTCIVSTTDFFMPIVDHPETFGAIASVNAISDVYAMGGEPLMAIAILGWPVNSVPPEIARRVMDGSKQVCSKAGIPLAGGHSIDCPEPVFGLAVTGKVRRENLKRNDSARPASLLYLTKPLGIGIITTAQKKGIVKEDHFRTAVDTMLSLNQFGSKVASLDYVSAMTDVTGFGLLGHLCEMCEGSNLSAKISFDKVPRFPFLQEYIEQKSTPGGTSRNWDSYGRKISAVTSGQRAILADPQTSGGLLLAVDTNRRNEFEKFAASHGLNLTPFGELHQKADVIVEVV